MTNTNPVVQSTPKEDRAGKHRTIYEVSHWEVFWRNFIAGMGRAAGSIMLYFLFIFLVGFLFMQLIWPQISGFFSNYTSLVNQLQPGAQPGSIKIEDSLKGVDNNSIDQLLEYYNYEVE